MASNVSQGVLVIPRTILGTTLDGSGLLAQPPHIGFVISAGSVSTIAVLWDNGAVDTNLTSDLAGAVGLLVVQASSSGNVNGLSGKVVRRTDNNASADFEGTVLFIFQIELDPVGAPKVFTDCVIVKSSGQSGAFWLAPLANIAVVTGR